MSIKAGALSAAHVVTLGLMLAVDSLQSPAVSDPLLAPIWTGAYAGIHGGANWIDVETGGGIKANTEDVTFGGHLGFNLSLGAVVAGIEADLNYENASFTADPMQADYASGEVRASGSLRGRVGLPIGPALLYATAGYAWTDVNLDYRSSSGSQLSGTESFNGIVYGIGAEAFVLPNLTLRVEALRYDYEEKDISISGAIKSAEDFDPSSTVVRAGLSFHFN